MKKLVDERFELNPDPNNPDKMLPQKFMERNEYWFKENGYLYEWKSYYDQGVDLIYSSQGVELVEIDMKSEKITTKEKGNWLKLNGNNVLEVRKYVDGNLHSKTIKEYDSTYRLLKTEETSETGFYGSRYYIYKGKELERTKTDDGDEEFYKNGLLDSVYNKSSMGYNSSPR